MRPACCWRAQPRKAPAGASEPASTANGESSGWPQNQDSAMICHGWTGQIFISSKWPARSSQKHTTAAPPLACRFFGASQDPAHQDTNNILAQWNKEVKAKTTSERPWYSSPFGQTEEMRESLFCTALQSTDPHGLLEVRGLLRKWRPPTKKR